MGGVLQDSGPSPDRLLIGATRSGSGSISYNWTGFIDEVAIEHTADFKIVKFNGDKTNKISFLKIILAFLIPAL